MTYSLTEHPMSPNMNRLVRKTARFFEWTIYFCCAIHDFFVISMPFNRLLCLESSEPCQPLQVEKLTWGFNVQNAWKRESFRSHIFQFRQFIFNINFSYSCRKNVKRHRMAVHKLTPEEIARNPGPGDYSNGNLVNSMFFLKPKRPEKSMVVSNQ